MEDKQNINEAKQPDDNRQYGERGKYAARGAQKRKTFSAVLPPSQLSIMRMIARHTKRSFSSVLEEVVEAGLQGTQADIAKEKKAS